MISSVLRYPGGKTKASIRQKILARFPSRFNEYREPFCGGAGIFFSVPPTVKRWINDIDENLIQFYLALRDRPKDFISKCREIEPHKKSEETDEILDGKRVFNKRMREIFDHFVDDTEMDPALRYFYINRTVWGGRVNFNIRSRLYFSNPNGWSITRTDKLEKASEWLQNTKITNYDYSALMYESGDDVFAYFDPPYKVNTDLTETSQLYANNFDDKDHEQLAMFVKSSVDKCLVSYDDDPFVRDLYTGSDDNIHIFEEQWTYCGTSSSKRDNQSQTKRVGKELLITNYQPPITDLFA